MFSLTAEYALRAAVWLAQSGDIPRTNQEIAEATQVPASYLSKVLQALGRAGIVRGARGKRGGFELARPAAGLTILEIVNTVDPIHRIETCPLGLESHRAQLCPLHRRMDQAMETIERTLGGATLAEMCEQPGARPLCETSASRSAAR